MTGHQDNTHGLIMYLARHTTPPSLILEHA
ncbi:hypothetical protein HNQ59_002056 [Chitinivorax tropicus]|uniref:Uncharacterized protein n=1 Tax=Chitinivorax tropicus TaxID=714531 RepID=A0A840MRC4_9PROT|nr:hypothetical protein [Chitinivorax tropicus]